MQKSIFHQCGQLSKLVPGRFNSPFWPILKLLKGEFSQKLRISIFWRYINFATWSFSFLLSFSQQPILTSVLTSDVTYFYKSHCQKMQMWNKENLIEMFLKSKKYPVLKLFFAQAKYCRNGQNICEAIYVTQVCTSWPLKYCFPRMSIELLVCGHWKATSSPTFI